MKETQQESPVGSRALLKNLNPHLLCVLCAGYYIEPTTIVECLHSFCRSCIVKYLETSRFCPICDVQLHKTKPLLSIRRDMILERLVYKIVPRLYANEMAERALPRKELYFSPDDLISISLQYHVDDSTSSPTLDGGENNGDAVANQDAKVDCQTFLSCPAAVTIKTLKKLIVSKYILSDEHHQVEFIHASEFLPDYLSIMDIAYCFEWKKISRMELRYQILKKSTIAVPIVEEVEELAEDVVMEEDARSVASSSLPFMSPASVSECGDASDTSLDSKPLMERLELERRRTTRKRKRKRETAVDEQPPESEPKPKKSLFDSLLQNTTNNNENEEKDFQEESDEDYSKYEQDIEEIIEIDDESDDDGRLKISSNVSEDDVTHDETTSQMFVIDEEEPMEEWKKTAVEEEKSEKVTTKEKHWKPEGRTKRKNKKAKHHHHHKRRLSQSPPPTATIVHSPDRDIMKLKVKLNTLPGYRHKDEKHHRHGKLHCGGGGGSASSASSIVSSPSRSSYKEDDAVLSEQSCDSVIAPKKSREDGKPPAEKQTAAVADVRKSSTCPSPQVAVDRGDTRSETPSRESAPPTRGGPRPKQPKPTAVVEQQPVKNTNSEPPPPPPLQQQSQQPQQQQQQQPHKTIIMPPSSITVSIITAEEKMKMEKDKTLMLTGNHDFENKRPSLEIVRVNGPPASPPAVVVDVPRASPKPKEQQQQQHQHQHQHHHHHEEQQPSNAPQRPKTKKPVPAVIPIKSAKPALTIIPQNRSPTGNNNNNNNNTSTGCGSNCNNTNNGTTSKHDEMQKNSLTISLENWSPNNDSALDLSGKSSRKDAVANGNKHGKNGGPYESSGMRNLMTLSDTAVHLRNMMSPSPSCKEPAAAPEPKKRFSNGGNHHHVGNNNGGGGSPKRHNGSVPLRIPVPPTSGSFKSSSSSSSSSCSSSSATSIALGAISSCQNNNNNTINNNNNNNNKSVKVSASAMSRAASDTKPKHGPPNQAVRHIPNPSVLLFRHHHQQLAQYAAAAAASAAAASAAAAAVNCNKRTTNAAAASSPPSPSPTVTASRMPHQHQMPGAIPLHTIRKMENMKTIEKVAAGLSVKANALYKQNFIENGRARLELPS